MSLTFLKKTQTRQLITNAAMISAVVIAATGWLAKNSLKLLLYLHVVYSIVYAKLNLYCQLVLL